MHVTVAGRTGKISRPALLGALIGKSAAYTVVLDGNRDRHLGDLVTLAALLRPADVSGRAALDRRELELLGNAVGNARLKPSTWAHVPDGEIALDRLSGVIRRAVRLRQERGAAGEGAVNRGKTT